MNTTARQILNDPVVRAGLSQAWLESNPGAVGGIEQGGFVLIDGEGVLRVSRWPAGTENVIVPPVHDDCCFDGLPIVATFHTHPNTGRDYRQQPSRMDVTSVRNDRNLKGRSYVGEFVLSNSTIYLIKPDGSVLELAPTAVLMSN